jgi:predicted tellurium resistance membrane protein TerC
MRITPQLHGNSFFVRQNGLLWATPLFLVLILVEVSDVIFAVDSIPAIFAVTTDPFIVLTANLMAILGLRAMFFLLAGAASKMHYLPYGLGHHFIVYRCENVIARCIPHANLDFTRLYRTGIEHHCLSLYTS